MDLFLILKKPKILTCMTVKVSFSLPAVGLQVFINVKFCSSLPPTKIKLHYDSIDIEK